MVMVCGELLNLKFVPLSQELKCWNGKIRCYDMNQIHPCSGGAIHIPTRHQNFCRFVDNLVGYENSSFNC